MKNKALLATVSVALMSMVILSLYLSLKKPKKANEVIFIGGLDNRNGDLTLQQQEDLLKKELDNKYKIKSFRYSNIQGVLNEIDKSKSSIYIVMFSAGARHSNTIASKVKEKGFDLAKLYIVEPWGKGENINRIKNSVTLGIPSSNVIVGSSSSTGKNVVPGATPTPNCKPGHWCAITEIGKIINEL